MAKAPTNRSGDLARRWLARPLTGVKLPSRQIAATAEFDRYR
jgi:hypothetical protein